MSARSDRVVDTFAVVDGDALKGLVAESCKIVEGRKARLDADRTAKPLTRIVTHARPGDLVGPGMALVDPQLVDNETGERIALNEPEYRPCFPCRGTGRRQGRDSAAGHRGECAYCRGEGDSAHSLWDGVVRICAKCETECAGDGECPECGAEVTS